MQTQTQPTDGIEPPDTAVPVSRPDPGAVTIRSLITGALLSAALGVAAPYENLLISGSPMHFDYSTPGAVFFFLLFLLIVSPTAALMRWQDK